MFARRQRNYWLTVVAVLVAAMYLFPIYWMVISGMKSSAELFRQPPTLWPHEPTLGAFRWILERDDIGRYLWNSFVIAGGTVALTLAIGAPAAYGLSRLRSRWINAMLIFVLVIQVLPPALLATPMFAIFRQMDLLNTRLAVILADTTRTLPFALIILRTQFLLIPRDLEDAARVDGCTRVSAFLRVVLPAVKGGLVVVSVICFIMAYGDLVYGLSFITRRELQPATVGLYSWVGAEYSDWNNVMAFATLFTAPVIIMFLLLQRQIVAGLTDGALK
jgi:multiple sugar transport system permease protein